jgi:hypothetical protein
MKKLSVSCGWVGWVLWLGLLSAAVAAEPVPLQYEVSFKDFVMATQTVAVVGSSDLLTVTTSFEADLPVFVALHHYAETMSASFRPDGTVVRLTTRRADGPNLTEISGNLQSDGTLKVIRRDRQGVSTNFISREDYDFNSLVMYGTAPADFLPTNRPVRVLQVAEGIVEPVDIQVISESTTFERQNIPTPHLVWSSGLFTSHSWHPERFSHLPTRYVRSTENGEFTFTLLR